MNKKIILIISTVIFLVVAGIVGKIIFYEIYLLVDKITTEAGPTPNNKEIYNITDQEVVGQKIQPEIQPKPQNNPKPTVNTHSSSPPVSTPSIQKQTCLSNPSPVFTHHVTDLDKISFIVPPPTMKPTKLPGDLKAHSYFMNMENSNKVPVYAPADMILIHGGYSVGGPYFMNFKVSCEVLLRFGHITDPIDSIKKIFPNLQTDSTWKELPPESQLSFKAGDIIAYTSGTEAGSWDFGVLNSAIRNRYADDPKWSDSTSYTTAVCPYEYFTSELKALYYAKFNPTGFAGNPPEGESFCK